MAERPIFVPGGIEGPVVREVMIGFSWAPGFALSQKQKCIKSLHEEANSLGYAPILEISTKSESDVGKQLSAFNLTIEVQAGIHVPVEVAYQVSKVYRDRPPIMTMQEFTPKLLRRQLRSGDYGPLQGFEFAGQRWDLEPPSAFYDWLFISALLEHPAWAARLLEFHAFTDIEFNPRRQVSCQARSAALFVCLSRRGLLRGDRPTREAFLKVVGALGKRNSVSQGKLL